MAFSLLRFCCICLGVFFLLGPPAIVDASTEFKVGDVLGWQLPDKNNTGVYNLWAEMNRFRIGDSLLFEYINDSVLVVEKWDYYHCNTDDAIAEFDNGKSVIQLDRSGAFYFISGGSDHCKKGQRMIVEVMSPHHLSPPAIAAPPYPSSTLAPSPSPSFSSGNPVSASFRSFSVFLAVALGALVFSRICPFRSSNLFLNFV